MTSEDLEYYRERALQERRLAASGSLEVRQIHAELAAQYEALLTQPALRPVPRPVLGLFRKG